MMPAMSTCYPFKTSYNVEEALGKVLNPLQSCSLKRVTIRIASGKRLKGKERARQCRRRRKLAERPSLDWKAVMPRTQQMLDELEEQ